ncbi:MAG TPA: FimV/HubP family polar landmark protein [Steroidobacteraceae bacterium]|jgi:pilus assembly protein FimV|nr:FimV/HubP family polar landmark protein [Steroidobacteraceae bacterium]
MVAKSLSRALALLLLCPAAAFALGLGDIRLQSSLNAPLNAEIELVGATPEDLSTLHASVASHDTFTHYGLDWPAFLGGISMRPEHTADGRDIIKLSSHEAITEPFVTLLIEVTWARGQLVREYTVLLDPPVYTPGQSEATNAPVAAPVVGAATREGSISRTPAPASTTAAATSGEIAAPAASPRARAAAASTQPGTTRLVQRGDTLSQIAGSLSAAGGASTRSWMVAVYQANPSAFESNMNLMHAGAVLRIPELATAAAIAPSDALGEIRRQYASWRGTPPKTEAAAAQPGQLHLVTPDQSTQPGTQPSTAGANAAVEARMHELEAQLQESRRLLEMRNAELAKLQAQIGAQGAAPRAPSAPAAAAPAPTPSAPPATPPAPASEVTPPPEAAPPPAAPVVVHTAPVATTPGPSLGSTLLRYWWIAALIVVAILARIGLGAWRSRQEVNFDDSLGRLATAGADSMNRDALGDTANMRAARDPTFVVEEAAAHERPRVGVAPVAARPVKVDDTMSNDTAINLDQGDPLAEADFHMAYGLYDQAADLVRIAISREPERRDLKLKLLEVFFVWGNKEQFLRAAHELAATRDQGPPGEWEKIVIMGKQLAPEDSLFSGGAAVSGAAAGGVDLDLEGGESRIDFDLLGEPVPEEAAAGLDLDIGSALGEKDASASQTTRATDANLALHGLDLGQDASAATTRQMTQHMDPMPADGVEPTVEQPQLHHDDNPTIRQKVERALKHSGGGEQTAELALDDLGLDLGALDTVDQPNLTSSPEAPTLVAGLDETSRQAMANAESHAHTTPGGSAASGAWRVKPEDMDATLPPVALSEFEDHKTGSADDTSGTSRLAALKGHDLDFDLGEMDAAPAANAAGEVDLDVGDAGAADKAFTITQKLSSEELALPDLEPATMSEVGTKLDLARAYMDMGDPEGARNILEEVLNEGSVAQKQEAQRLLQSLPG